MDKKLTINIPENPTARYLIRCVIRVIDVCIDALREKQFKFDYGWAEDARREGEWEEYLLSLRWELINAFVSPITDEELAILEEELES